MKNKIEIDTSYIAQVEKSMKALTKSLESFNQIKTSNLLGFSEAMKSYSPYSNAKMMGIAEALQGMMDTYEKLNMPFLSSGLRKDSMISSLQKFADSLEMNSKKDISDSFKAISSSMEVMSKTLASERLMMLQQIDYSSLFAENVSKAASWSDILETAHTLVEDELEEEFDDSDAFTETEIQEALQEQAENPKGFQERAAGWTEKKKVQFFIIWQIIMFIWGNFCQPYFQEKVGMPVMTYVVSNVKEVPKKGAKVIGKIRENVEAIIIEDTNYYYKVSFTDENGETKEGYVAKRNLKLIEEESQEEINSKTEKQSLC